MSLRDDTSWIIPARPPELRSRSGIRYLDTAASYGPSDAYLGKVRILILSPLSSIVLEGNPLLVDDLTMAIGQKL